MDPWKLLLERLAQLRDSWPTPPWSWDGRFHAVVASFAKADEPTARASAMHAFPRGWTAKSLDAAPEEMRALAGRTGGLRAGQRLLAGDELIAARLFGLWWPWGNGETISLRIGILDLDATSDPVPRIRELFGA